MYIRDCTFLASPKKKKKVLSNYGLWDSHNSIYMWLFRRLNESLCGLDWILEGLDCWVFQTLPKSWTFWLVEITRSKTWLRIWERKRQQGRRKSMIGFRSLPIEMPNGGTRLSTMSPPWLALVFSVCLMPCHILDGKYVFFFFLFFSFFHLQSVFGF